MSQSPFFLPVNGHTPPTMARALYLLFDRTGEQRYKTAADRYAIFTFGYPRDPVAPWNDRLRNTRVARRLLDNPHERFDPRGANNHTSRSWMYGCALDPALREFRRRNPDDDCFDAIGDALFDWLQSHRVDRARGGVEFLARLHALLPIDHPRAELMRERCTRSLRWQFGCPFDSGAIGMHAQDDEWLGMTAGAPLAYDEVRRAGWLDADLAADVDPLARKANNWLIDKCYGRVHRSGPLPQSYRSLKALAGGQSVVAASLDGGSAAANR